MTAPQLSSVMLGKNPTGILPQRMLPGILVVPPPLQRPLRLFPESRTELPWRF